jgi:hypothetical protein
MSGPFTVPAQQGKSTEYDHHLLYDGAGLNPAAAGFAQGNSVEGAGGFMENLQGHRSGVTAATPWVSGSWGPAAAGRPSISPYGDSSPAGAGTTYAAASLTDTNKAAWGVSDGNSGASVTYGANTITDTARNNANAWVVGNTAQYVGVIIITATGKILIGASAAAGVITGAANWIGGTPAAGEAYRINPQQGFAGRQITSVAAGAKTIAIILWTIAQVANFTAWSNGTPANGTPYIINPVDVLGQHYLLSAAVSGYSGRTGGENADNFYKAAVEESNTEVI